MAARRFFAFFRRCAATGVERRLFTGTAGRSAFCAASAALGGALRTPTGFVLGALVTFAVAVSSPGAAQTPAPDSRPAMSPDTFPAWAYPWAPDFKAPPDDGIPRRVPDSAAAFTVTQERDLFFAPDWHPNDHPPMPDIVARQAT